MEPVQLTSLTAYKRTSALDSTMFYMGNLMSFLVRGEDTGGRFALMEIQAKPGNEPPPHLHEWEHETFYVLEDAIEVYCEDKVLMVHPGEVVFIPQGKPHAFYIRSPHLRMLILVQAVGDRAVGLDRYFIQMAEPTTSMNLPTEAVTYLMDDPSQAISLGEANDVRFLSLEEIAKELPHYPGFGANLEKIE